MSAAVVIRRTRGSRGVAAVELAGRQIGWTRRHEDGWASRSLTADEYPPARYRTAQEAGDALARELEAGA